MSKLYGVGVGPGDPELITVKALNVIKAVDTVCFAGKSEVSSIAFSIARQAYPKIISKKKVCINFPMTKDALLLEKSHSQITQQIKELLEQGDVALLTLGDPGIYSTYSYIADRLRGEGIDVVTVAGITSFSAAAANAAISLTLSDEELHIIPSSYSFEQAFEYSGTLVFMKAGKSYESLIKFIRDRKPDCDVYMIENCGLKSEKIFKGVGNLPESSGYFTIVIIRGN